MNNTKTAILTKGPVKATLMNLSLPMFFGLLGMVAFNLVDTFFVGQLGTKELAALSFTFPVVLIIASVTLGVGVGTSSIISRSIGEGNHKNAEQITIASMILSVIMALVFIAIGFSSFTPVFKMLGAKNEILPLIRRYMFIWYSGLIFVVIPMIANNVLRALGDTKTPSILMLLSFSLNIVLDPILIFGLGAFPRMGLRGAAIATVFSRSVTFFLTLWILIFREKLLTSSMPSRKDLINAWKQILYLGIPTAATRMVYPLAVGMVTRIISFYGPEAVAAFGISSKFEFFAMILVMALASVIGPFVGQNWGAGKHSRLLKGIQYSEFFSLMWGAFIFIALFIFAPYITYFFNKNPEIIRISSSYLRIASVGFGFQGILIVAAASLIVLNKPFHASGLVVFEMFVLYVPLAFLGSKYLGIDGIFYALSFSYITTGIISHVILKKTLRKITVS